MSYDIKETIHTLAGRGCSSPAKPGPFPRGLGRGWGLRGMCDNSRETAFAVCPTPASRVTGICLESLGVCLQALSAKVAVEALKGTYGTGSWDFINLTEWADGHFGGLLTNSCVFSKPMCGQSWLESCCRKNQGVISQGTSWPLPASNLSCYSNRPKKNPKGVCDRIGLRPFTTEASVLSLRLCTSRGGRQGTCPRPQRSRASQGPLRPPTGSSGETHRSPEVTFKVTPRADGLHEETVSARTRWSLVVLPH